MKYIFTLAFVCHFWTFFAQNCGENYSCWREKGILAYQKGDKETAIVAFKMAKKCPDLPLTNDLKQWTEKAYTGEVASMQMVAKTANMRSENTETDKIDATRYYYEKGRNEFGNGNYWAAYSFFVHAQTPENLAKVNAWLDKCMKGGEALKCYESGNFAQALQLFEAMDSPLKGDFAKTKIAEMRDFYAFFQPIFQACKTEKKDSLSLKKQQLSIIPTDILSLSQLKYLDLSDNDLTKFSLKTAKLFSLNSLNLAHNHVEMMSEELLATRTLTTLDISHNRISEIPKQIGQLYHLQSLDLSYNHVSAFPTEITKLTQLKHLYLTSNDLMQFPTVAPQFSHLKSLHLSQNAIHDVPPSIGNLTELEELDLSDNTFLRFIPKQAGYLKHLKILDLSENVFMFELTSVLGDWQNLEQLSLRNCGMNVIPVEIGQLKKLTLLDMEGNHITFLPTEIGALTQLEALDLSHNSLRTLPAHIGTLTALEELNLSDNPLLHSLPAEIKLLKNLQELDLRGGNFTPTEKNRIRRLVPKGCEVFFE